MSDGFYLWLPSNSSMNVYPRNVQSDYRTQLGSEIRLEGGAANWECGLCEIIYPR